MNPKFLKTHRPDVGMCIQDIPGAYIDSTYNPEKVIFFSKTVDSQEEQELIESFHGTSPKFTDNYESVFEALGWKLIKIESFIFGELEIIQVFDY